MKCWVGLGSNLGDRAENLEKAARALADFATNLRASPLFETAALLPPEAQDSWNRPYLNAVVEMQVADQSPREILQRLKQIEKEMGRTEAARWAPRPLDLDLLACESRVIQEEDFHLPHTEIYSRPFVLAPFKHLTPLLELPLRSGSLLQRSRAIHSPLPLWMEIFNLTPDSFSDGGQLKEASAFLKKIEEAERNFIPLFDLGGESTRPGAQSVSMDEEWDRLQPALAFLQDRYRHRFFRPWISVDTRHASVARRALALGADIINDVGGLADPGMLKVLQESSCQYVLMHSLSVPADPAKTLNSNEDPIQNIKQWALEKMEKLSQEGIDLQRIIFDPGLGFGKTAQQSLLIVRRIHEFFDLPLRLMVGHSRKSFLKTWSPTSGLARDGASVGISLQLARRGVDILRVHEPVLHLQAYHAFQGVQP